jgi:hypothetical protein
VAPAIQSLDPRSATAEAVTHKPPMNCEPSALPESASIWDGVPDGQIVRQTRRGNAGQRRQVGGDVPDGCQVLRGSDCSSHVEGSEESTCTPAPPIGTENSRVSPNGSTLERKGSAPGVPMLVEDGGIRIAGGGVEKWVLRHCEFGEVHGARSIHSQSRICCIAAAGNSYCGRVD